MSQALLQEARTISKQLSAGEKIQLIEWLSVQLRQEFDATPRATEPDTPTGNDEFTNGHDNPQHGNAQHVTTEPAALDPSSDEVSPTWTDEEIQAMMKPEPKTGAEIVALLQKLDLSSWEEQEIPDVVEWLQDQREQSSRQRQAQWGAMDS